MSRALVIIALAILACMPRVQAEPRIISTDAATTQILLGLGAGPLLVGVDATSTLPEPLAGVPRVGYHRALSAEGLLALQPTLLLGSPQAGPAPVLALLASAGVDVTLLETAYTVEALSDNIDRVAALLPASDNPRQLQQTLAQQASRLPDAPVPGRSAAFVLSSEPGKLRVAGRETAGDALMALLGASNVVDHKAYRTLSVEALLALDPALILVASRDDATPQTLLALNPLLAHGRAARAGQVLGVDASQLVAGLGPGALTEAERLVGQLGDGL